VSKRVVVVVFGSVYALSGCGPEPIVAKPPSVEEADDQVATCKVARDPLNPLVVEWPGTAKVDLETVSKRGVVVVSYKGCTLKVLSGCEAKGKYDYVTATPTRDRLEMSTKSELYAQLPLGAASLKGEIDTGSSLELEYVAVGQHLAKAPGTLKGQCEGASHYVRSMTVGAYTLDAFGGGGVKGEASVAGAGVGAGRREGLRHIRGAGDVTSCSAGGKGECTAVLQLGLAPLDALGGGESGETGGDAPTSDGPKSGGNASGGDALKIAREAYKIREQAMQKQRAGDAVGCLALLDKADKVEPDTANEGYAQSTRYMCELQAGKCAQGKARLLKWFERFGKPLTPPEVKSQLETLGGKCK
jgi:hypothetical protein